MADFNIPNQPVRSPALDRPEKKRRKPIFIILTAALIVVLALLLLCLLPGHPVLSLVLPTPKPVVVPLEPLAFQEITPPPGGGVSTVVFPIGPTTVTPPPFPKVELTANGSSEQIEINHGFSANLAWETEKDPDECTASGDWSGSKDPAGGTEATGPLFALPLEPVIYSYKIICENQYGIAVDTISIKVIPPGGPPPPGQPPTTDLTVNGSDEVIQIPDGSFANLSWSTANNPTVCNASGNWSGSKNPAGGSEPTGPLSGPKNYDYKITCSNDYGSSEDTVTVVVTESEEEACIECPQPVTVSASLGFTNNQLVSGSFPQYQFTAPDGGKVNIRASISQPLGGPCLESPGPFQVFLYDNGVIKYGAGATNPIYGTLSGWSGNFPEFTVTSGSTHVIRLVIQTNCAGGFGAPIQSGVTFSDVSLTIIGPSSPVCRIDQQALLPLKFANNQLVSGSFPEYKFNAFDSEIVNVSGSISGFSGGPCLSPPFKVFLYDNDTLKFGPLNSIGNSWSGAFPPFNVSPGPHSIKLTTATNCSGSLNAPIQSLVTIGNASMNVDIENPSGVTGPEICEQAIVSNLMDFGDAPDGPAGNFPSLLASNGARHNEHPFLLGARVDKEPDSHQIDNDSPNPAIGKDDGWDGAKVTITNVNWPSDQPIYLNVLDDLNGNLEWNVDTLPLEHVVTDAEFFIPTGQSIEYTLPPTIPLVIGLPDTWKRFTLTDIKLGANYNGSWPTPFEFGETEDYIRLLPLPHNAFLSIWHRIGHSIGISVVVTPPFGPGGAPAAPGVTPAPQPIKIVISRGPEGGFFQVVGNRVIDALRSLLGQGVRLTARDLKTFIGVQVPIPLRPTTEVVSKVFEQIRVEIPVLQFIAVPAPAPTPTPIPMPQFSLKAGGAFNTNNIIEISYNFSSRASIEFIVFNASGQIIDKDKAIIVGGFSGSGDVFTAFPNIEGAVGAFVIATIDGKEVARASQTVGPFEAGGVAPTPAAGVTCGGVTITVTGGPYNIIGPPVTVELTAVSATGGTSPYTWSVSSGSLPPTTSINSSTGVVSGTATTLGTYTPTIQASDANSCTGTAVITFNVSEF